MKQMKSYSSTWTNANTGSKNNKISIHPGTTHFFEFPKNGPTYGSASDATFPEAEPDLISALGKDGTIGYVLKKDLDGEIPNSPKEALAIQKKLEDAGGVREIPLYDVDGETVIDVFSMGWK